VTALVADSHAELAVECRPPLHTSATPRSARGYASGKDDYLRRLRKIEGQVRGLQKMIDADAWCPDVVTQVASATRALQEVAVGLLNDHLHHCVRDAADRSGTDADQVLDEVTGTIRQVIRL
jgi:DNA-binding FrmR family transcriptional regulator